MPEDLKKLKTSNYTDPRAANKEITSNIEPIKTGCAVKSPSIEIIKEVERLVNKANNKLLELPKILVTPAIYRGIAIEEIDLFQRTTLHELKKEYE